MLSPYAGLMPAPTPTKTPLTNATVWAIYSNVLYLIVKTFALSLLIAVIVAVPVAIGAPDLAPPVAFLVGAVVALCVVWAEASWVAREIKRAAR